MAAVSGNDFAELTEEMTLEKFKRWTVEALWTSLSLRNKSSEGDFETIVYRLVLFFLPANIFWSTGMDQMKILLMYFTLEAVAFIV